ncbi:hypothetical protein OBBRIDRAFT_618231 [Obba rivulosa]|uniref:Uncharacterized protein n=1 Tax=Obba rivulosa TaxID=1052685 RepID=A0A8E2DTH9_9APHY|nr:hypothetical protein OBBRIDRAFT_618231 [Obba rivulosa]
MAFQEPSDKMKQHEHKAQRSSSLSSSTHQERHGLPILPTPGFVDAIASGAHYAGGLSSPHEDAEQHAAHKRTHGMHSEGDPAAQAAYNGVIRDLTEASSVRPSGCASGFM